MTIRGEADTWAASSQRHSAKCVFVAARAVDIECGAKETSPTADGLCDAMPVAHLTLELRIEHARSLKDRRQVVRSMKDQLRQGFNISIAEMDEGVTWQSATLGVVAISHSRSYLHGLVEEVERAARRMVNELGAELADSFWEYLES